MRTGTLLLSLAAFSITGCMNLTPVGPMAELMHKKESAKDSESKSEKPKAKKMEAAAPIIQSAPPPPLPALLVTPGEVAENNAQTSARRLMDEMEADRKSMDTMPRYSEVSIIKK